MLEAPFTPPPAPQAPEASINPGQVVSAKCTKATSPGPCDPRGLTGPLHGLGPFFKNHIRNLEKE